MVRIRFAAGRTGAAVRGTTGGEEDRPERAAAPGTDGASKTALPSPRRKHSAAAAVGARRAGRRGPGTGSYAGLRGRRRKDDPAAAAVDASAAPQHLFQARDGFLGTAPPGRRRGEQRVAREQKRATEGGSSGPSAHTHGTTAPVGRRPTGGGGRDQRAPVRHAAATCRVRSAHAARAAAVAAHRGAIPPRRRAAHPRRTTSSGPDPCRVPARPGGPKGIHRRTLRTAPRPCTRTPARTPRCARPFRMRQKGGNARSEEINLFRIRKRFRTERINKYTNK